MGAHNDGPSWQLLLDAIDAETDPKRRRNLEIVAKHVVYEVAGDIPALMTTLVREPVYHFWGPTDTEPAQGAAAVQAHYQRLIDIGKNRLDFDITRVIADHRHVVTEGDFRFAHLGSQVADLPNPPVGLIDPDARYLVATHCLIVWPINDDGLILGEDVFAGEHPRVIRRLAAGEMTHLGLPA
jgi:hypothetical protein